MRPVLNALLYLPSRRIVQTPAAAGLTFADLTIETDDGQRLHGWWIPARSPATGHVLFCHGNAGNVGDRVAHASLLCARGFDVLLFDYRGYGRSGGRPDENGTYSDAWAARTALFEQAGVDARHVLYLGESLGGAVALDLALKAPPAGLILQSAFTSVRDMARRHYPFVPRALVPDAYPSLRRIRGLQAPLLVIHGDRDQVVPHFHGEELCEAAPGHTQMRILVGVGHNDVIALSGPAWADAIASWAVELPTSQPPDGTT
jgi:fermentation-respiration switch protein FrsA (DUF1100 family)